MLKLIPFLFPCLALCSACTPSALEQASARADSLIEASIAAGETSGAVLLVSRDGKVVHHRAYGHAQRYSFGGAPLAEPIPISTETVFDLASLTKVFATTFGIMMLVDEGTVSLDDPVRHHLPAFSGPSKDSVTVRHLLTHSAGLLPWKPVYYHASNKDEALAYISSLPLATPVGAERHYSDLGFMLLGYLIEAKSGMPMDDYLNEKLYMPLGLAHIGFNLSTDKSGFAATSHGNPFEKRMVEDDNFGYVCDEDPESFTNWRRRVLIGEVNDGNAYHAHNGLAGHAGLFSTASDLHVLLQLLLNMGIHDGRQLISPEIISTFLTPDAFGNGLGWGMASSVMLIEDAPAGTFGHTGFTGTYALAMPEENLAILLLTNRQHGDVGPDGRYPSVNGLRISIVLAFSS